MIKNKYGPHLIGGDSSQLGVANIRFSLKLKLMRALKKLDADYIIVDLGGDTSYNILDFFLAADIGLVLTTCDPASYLDAYRFIKVALYRKLSRLFGPESVFSSRKNGDLSSLIHDAILSPNGSTVKNIMELIERVKNEQPFNLPFITEVLVSFSPFLVINKVTTSKDAIQIAHHIKTVSKKMLSIDVVHLGNLSYQSKIEQSARTLIPDVAINPNGKFAKELGKILKHLLEN